MYSYCASYPSESTRLCMHLPLTLCSILTTNSDSISYNVIFIIFWGRRGHTLRFHWVSLVYHPLYVVATTSQLLPAQNDILAVSHLRTNLYEIF